METFFYLPVNLLRSSEFLSNFSICSLVKEALSFASIILVSSFFLSEVNPSSASTACFFVNRLVNDPNLFSYKPRNLINS